MITGCSSVKPSKIKYYVLSLVIITLTVFLTCSKYTYRTIYNQLDFILYLEVKKYFNPDDAQSEFVRQKLSSLLNWNRVNVLPRVRDLMFYMRVNIQNGLTEKDLMFLYDKLEIEFTIIAEKAAPDAAEFVLTLNPEQINNYKQETVKHRMEWEKENRLNGRTPAENRTRYTVKLLSNLYGSFSKEQTEKIKSYVEGKTIPDYNRREFQIIKQNEFIELLRSDTEKEKMAVFLKNWITGNPAFMPSPYKERFEARRKFNINLYLYVDSNIVTVKQRAHAVVMLDKWIETINNLTNEN
jgi:hypothetical protein